jgi:short-subunit dehydrogenase involved in D-alanine esterification of teichoic acids
MNISGNTIFIPGSTSGIGLALAVALKATGNTVIVGGRRADLLERIAAEHPGLDTVQIDTADAARHMLSESIRLQLAGTSVKVVELEPPAVRTALLPGQEDSAGAMPLDEFVAEVMGLLEAQPHAKEIQVERVKFLRYGEARGDYDQVVATLNSIQN